MTKDETGGVQSRASLEDVTDLDEGELARHIGRARTTLSESHRALIRATDEQELLDEICRIAVGGAGYPLAWVGFADSDQRKTVRPVASCGEAAPYLDEISVTWGDDELGRGATGRLRPDRPSPPRARLHRGAGLRAWRARAARHGLASG